MRNQVTNVSQVWYSQMHVSQVFDINRIGEQRMLRRACASATFLKKIYILLHCIDSENN